MNSSSTVNVSNAQTTSYAGLRQQHGIKRIEIPLIQRDYAQGRTDPGTARIRDKLLEALLHALPGKGEQALDFVYGEMNADGKLIPLDGQQRLSTLFLLHWYLAVRLNFVDVDWDRLPQFSYATRDSAKTFCAKLLEARPFAASNDDGKDLSGQWLSKELRDQGWFRRAWMRDPTVSGMLVSLDALHVKVSQLGWDEAALRHAWNRLICSHLPPPIHFDLLQISNIGPIDRQYIRMNARGKALTAFERFKAGFEKQLQELPDQQDYRRFACRIDGHWTDLLWQLRDRGTGEKKNEVINDEFLCLIRYLGAFAVWQHPEDKKTAVELSEPQDGQDELDWAIKVFFDGGYAQFRRQFLFDALDALARKFKTQLSSIEFGQWFVNSGHTPGKVSLFKANKSDIDLLSVCVHGKTFTLAEQLMLFGLLCCWMESRQPNPAVLRVLRNLLWAWDADLDRRQLPSLVQGVKDLVAKPLPKAGLQAGIADKFSGSQADEESQKQARKAVDSTLLALMDRLEDHPLLKGSMRAFDFENLAASGFTHQVDTFYAVFPPNELCLHGSHLTGALLSKGDYSRSWYDYEDRFQFGGNQKVSAWVYVLTGTREPKARQRLVKALAELLDDVARRKGPTEDRLRQVTAHLLTAQERKSPPHFNWRYYLVKYPSMREAAPYGVYVAPQGEMGIDLMSMQTEKRLASCVDPFIYAVVSASKQLEKVTFWVDGSQNWDIKTRWLRTLKGNNILRPDPAGWMVEGPEDPPSKEFLGKLKPFSPKKQRGQNEWLISTDPIYRGITALDQKDRVSLGINLFKSILPFYE